MTKLFLCLFLLSFTVHPCFTQELSNTSLAMTNYGDRSIDSVLLALRQAGNDSGKVKLLVRASCYYWRGKQRSVDSMLFYAQKALLLSRQLQYQPGLNEACFILCKVLAQNGRTADAENYLPLVPKDQQARLLLVLTEQYLFQPEAKQENLDIAYKYLVKALSVAEGAASQHWQDQSRLTLGKYHFSLGELTKGKEYILQIIRHYQKTGEKSEEANYWYALGLYMPDTDSSFDDALTSYRNAAALYKAINDKDNETEVLWDMAGANNSRGRYDTAKSLLMQAVSIRKTTKNKKLFKYYRDLSIACQVLGEMDEALTYALEGRKNMIMLGDTSQIAGFYYVLGDIYADMGQPENSVANYLQAAPKLRAPLVYFIYQKTAEQLILLGKERIALEMILQAEKEKPPVTISDKETIAGAKGDCYYALHQIDSAEKSYKEMIRLDELAQQQKGTEIFHVTSLAGPAPYFKIARFYADQKKYALASPYLHKALQSRSFENKSSYSANLLKDIWLLQFKVDSATGNYLAAIKSYASYTAIKDSIFSIAKVKQMQSLSVAFESSQKENSIQRLQQASLLQQKEIDQSRQLRYFTFAGIVMLLLLLALGYNRYRLKQKSNQQLQEKQGEITVKNEKLQQLVNEKEWLLKEVHHRVKNNLQTVVSLLELQSEYLDSEALSAIHNSQNRIHAMSLIHQKLYQSDVSSSIQMQNYLPELVQHLRDIYQSERPINFQLDISLIELDVCQAIPIGLIVNEAVTNCIKYAFTDKDLSPEIFIGLRRLDTDRIVLTVADNGSGLPASFNASDNPGLGFKLMTALVEDLDGQLIIESTNGAAIKVFFTASVPFDKNIKHPEKLTPLIV